MSITCMELSAAHCSVLHGSESALHADFPADSNEHYASVEEAVFRKLHFSKYINF